MVIGVISSLVLGFLLCGIQGQPSPGMPGLNMGQNQNCVATCRNENKCPNQQTFVALRQASGQNCRDCLDEECDMTISANQNEYFECNVEARMECTECPNIVPDRQQIRRLCLQCLRQCKSRSRPGPGPRPGPGQRPGPGPMPGIPGRMSFFRQFMCMKKCRQNGTCPTREEIQNFLNDTVKACRDCIVDECGSFDGSNRSTFESCFSEAKAECSACPVETSDQQMRMKKCRGCVMQCFMPGNYAHRKPMFRPMKSMACIENCASETSCPSRDQAAGAMDQMETECKNCIVEECGYFTKQNRSKIADCIQRARIDCMECPGIPVEEQTRMKNCKRCISNCSPFRGKDQRSRFNPMQIFSCNQKCQISNGCPSMREIIRKMADRPPACLQCLRSECGMGPGSSMEKRGRCFVEAYDECADECPDMSDAEKAEMINCSSCLQGCFPGKGRLPGASQGIFSPRNLIMPIVHRLSCMKQCESSPSCPSGEDIMRKKSLMPKNCTSCLEEACGEINRSTFRENSECVMDAYDNCDECPARTSEEQMQTRQCMSCIKGCSPFGPRGSYFFGMDDMKDVFKHMSCFGKCTSPQACPTLSEIRNKVRQLGTQCKACITKRCGSMDLDTKSDLADCLSDAHQDCIECPTLTSQEQVRRRNCKACIMNCAPKKEENMGRFSKRPLEMISCVKKCGSDNRCPTPHYIVRKLLTQTDQCKSCIVKNCGTNENIGTYIDCIERSWKQCSGCSNKTSAEKRKMRSCKSCIGKCLGGRGRCSGPFLPGPHHGKEMTTGESDNDNDERDSFEVVTEVNSIDSGSDNGGGMLENVPSVCRQQCAQKCPIPTGHQQSTARCLLCIGRSNCAAPSSNARIPLRCLVLNVTTCAPCQTLPPVAKNFLATCVPCLRACAENQSGSRGFRPPGFGAGERPPIFGAGGR